MSYPPPPGINSLPPRPPASANKSGFKAAFNQSTTYSSPATSRPNHAAAPPQHAAHYGSSYSSYSSAPSASVASYPTSYSAQHQPQHAYGSSQYGQQSAQSYSAAPQIQNPFPVPGAAGPSVTAGSTAPASSDYDPDMAAQIAQWQSAYLPRDATTAAPNAAGPNAVDPVKAAEAANMDPSNKKTVMRQGGGKKWSDDTLLEWDPSHLRLFVGNLAGEVTDESLLKAFSRWTSVQKARVIRDNRTNKSKGYGFVSFSDADDFFQAAKDMNNKYIQSRPVTVRKANTEIKVSNAKDPRKKGKKQGKHDRQDHQSREPNLGPRHGGGIVKPGQKTKNGLKLLG